MRERHLTKPARRPAGGDELRSEIQANIDAMIGLEKRAVRYNDLKREEREFFWLLLMDLAAVLLPEAGLAGRVAWRLLQRADRRLNTPRVSQRSAASQSRKGD